MDAVVKVRECAGCVKRGLCAIASQDRICEQCYDQVWGDADTDDESGGPDRVTVTLTEAEAWTVHWEINEAFGECVPPWESGDPKYFDALQGALVAFRRELWPRVARRARAAAAE